MDAESHTSLLHAQDTGDDATTFSPQTFNDYLGQSAIKEKLAMFVQASSMRNEALDHILLFGPPGLGKTTLAQVIAAERGMPIKITSGPALERAGDLVSLLSGMERGEFLFIDEIHRLPRIVEETLYTAMEQFCVDMIVGQGAGAQSIRLPLAPCTIIGATTKTAGISGPLQTRFGIIERLDFYTAEELAHIVRQNADFFRIAITTDAAHVLGSCARGTPRIVKRLLRRVRDYAQVKGNHTITLDLVEKALAFLGIDHDGLTKLDRAFLGKILVEFDGGPVGLDTLSAVTGEDKETIEQYIEPFLMRLGMIQKGPRGRFVPAHKIVALRKRFGLHAQEYQARAF